MNREELMKKLVQESIDARGKVLEARKQKFQRFDSPPILGVEASYGGAVSSGGGIAPIEPGPQPWEDTYSMFFDGDDASMHTTSDPAPIIFDLTDSVTVSAWVKPTVLVGNNDGIVDYLTSSDARGYGIVHSSLAGGKWRAWIGTEGGGGDVKINASVNLILNTWQHVLITYDSVTGDLVLYLNATPQPAVSAGAGQTIRPHNAGEPLLIGAATDTPNKEFNGYINEASIFSNAFTQAEVDEIYNGGKPGDLNYHSAVSNGVAWWRMGEDATFGGGTWTIPNQYNSQGTITSVGMTETDRSTDVPS